MRPFYFDLTYEIVTPLFMSGNDPMRPELRASAIRGAVRAWYRALDPRFLDLENSTFGAAFDDEDHPGESHRSPFRLQVLKSPDSASYELHKADHRRFNRGTPPNRTNGILYTGYTLLDSFNRRRAFEPSDSRSRRTFTLRLLILRPDLGRDGMAHLRRILASFWALGHLGALGNRANRGWGSVQLTELKAGPKSSIRPQINGLLTQFAPATQAGPREWAGEVAGFLADVADWPEERERKRIGHASSTPHIGSGARVLVYQKPFRDWERALNEVGTELQAFRRERGVEDRQNIVEELLVWQPRSTRGSRLEHAPQRTAFGLPFTMRYALPPRRLKEQGISQLRPKTIEFNPGVQSISGSSPRHASPLRLRVVRLASGYHPVVVRLVGDPVGAKPRSLDNPNATPEVAIGGRVINDSPVGYIEPLPRAEPPDAMLDAFVRKVKDHAFDLPVPG